MAVVATFEQNFGLLKDPTKNNSFNIKFCLLRLKEQSALMSGQTHSERVDVSMSGVIEEVMDD